MYGMLSGRREGRGRKVYAYTALAGALCSVFVPAILELISPESRHIIPLSAFAFLISVFFSFHGYVEMWNDTKYFKRIGLYFYIYTAHLIVLAWYNDFSLLYFVTLLFAFQICSFSFREQKRTFWYILSMSFITIGIILYSPSVTVEAKVECVILVFFSFAIEFILAGNKAAIVSHMRVHRDVLVALSQKTENALFVTTLDGKIIDMNQVSHDIFSYSADELINQDFEILRKTPLTHDEIAFGLETIRKDSFWISETILRKKSGEEMNVYLSIGKIEKSDLQFLVYRVRDTTAQIKAQEELIRAKEIAEAAVIAKSRFVATMSHEIRTPLNGVIGMAHLLQQTNLSERQQEYADTIEKSGQSLMVLINDILDFSKLESGKMTLEEQRIDIREIIFEICNLLRPHAERKALVLSMEVDEGVPNYFMIDGARLKQMLLNLIGNAIKFTDKGFVKIFCTSRYIYGELHEVNIEVADSGIGIPSDKVHSLFDMFSQVDSSTSRKYGGTGLGLTISKQIAELMGGTIKVESQFKVGSKFKIQIHAKESKIHTVTVEKGEVDFPTELFANDRFLIVEDNSVNQKVLIYMLELIGLSADVVSNGKEAVDVVLKNHYDLLFMDVQMPEMDGLEASQKIKKVQNNPPYIIALTANHGMEDRASCLEAGMDDFISKPFAAGQIKVALINWKQKQ